MSRLKVRNIIAHAAILRKGGAHVKTKSSQRTLVKKEVKKAVDDWISDKSWY